MLVSSDSDFTRLASRIREQGLDVYGIGQAKTPEAFRKACKRFIFLENLGAQPAEAKTVKSEGGREAAGKPAKAALTEARDLILRRWTRWGRTTIGCRWGAGAIPRLGQPGFRHADLGTQETQRSGGGSEGVRDAEGGRGQVEVRRVD